MDATTLAQVKKCADAFRGGLGVKFNPNTFDHGQAGIAGSVQNLRIVGNRLLGDLRVASTYASRAYLLELAANQPDSFGLSIDFDMYTENIGGLDYARCASLDAVTVVDVPAANDGLFRAGRQPADPDRARSALAVLFARRSPTSPMQTNLSTSTATGFAARLSTLQAEGKSAGAAIQHLAAKDRVGFNEWCKAGRPAGPPPAKITTAKGFSAHVDTLMASGNSRGTAILQAAQHHPKGYKRLVRGRQADRQARRPDPRQARRVGNEGLPHRRRINEGRSPFRQIHPRAVVPSDSAPTQARTVRPTTQKPDEHDSFPTLDRTRAGPVHLQAIRRAHGPTRPQRVG